MKDVITQAVDKMRKLANKAEEKADRPDADEGAEEEVESEEEEEDETPDLGELETINETLESDGNLIEIIAQSYLF